MFSERTIIKRCVSINTHDAAATQPSGAYLKIMRINPHISMLGTFFCYSTNNLWHTWDFIFILNAPSIDKTRMMTVIKYTLGDISGGCTRSTIIHAAELQARAQNTKIIVFKTHILFVREICPNITLHLTYPRLFAMFDMPTAHARNRLAMHNRYPPPAWMPVPFTQNPRLLLSIM